MFDRFMFDRFTASARRVLRQLGLDLGVTRGARPLLIAAIDSPRGRVGLR